MKLQTDYTLLFQHDVMKRMVSIALYGNQLVQHSYFNNQLQGLQSSCLQIFTEEKKSESKILEIHKLITKLLIFSSSQFSLIYIVPNQNKYHIKALQRYSLIQANYNPIHCKSNGL